MHNRDEELKLYEDAYRAGNYGMGDRRKEDVKKILADLQNQYGPRSLLDLSTGRGETCRMAVAAGLFPVEGTEAVRELTGWYKTDGDEDFAYQVIHWTADKSLPHLSAEMDHVTCFDVVEHLIEEDIHNLVREAWRVARCTVTISASERSSCLGPGGRDLHISKRPAAAWQALFESLTGARWIQIGVAGGSPCFRAIKG